MQTVAPPSVFGTFSEVAPQLQPARTAVIRRRTTPTQGRALEILGHAVEYLADSRLYEESETASDGAAIRTLMSCSRQVFAECSPIQPWHERARASLLRRLHLQSAPEGQSKCSVQP
jgi:hypothetical protein